MVVNDEQAANGDVLLGDEWDAGVESQIRWSGHKGKLVVSLILLQVINDEVWVDVLLASYA
jgi:hypothetical protein